MLVAVASMLSGAVRAGRPKIDCQKSGKIIKPFGIFDPVPAVLITSPGNVHPQLLQKDIPELQPKLKIRNVVVFGVAQEYWCISVAANVSSQPRCPDPTRLSRR
jgi:hypothetical protein